MDKQEIPAAASKLVTDSASKLSEHEQSTCTYQVDNGNILLKFNISSSPDTHTATNSNEEKGKLIGGHEVIFVCDTSGSMDGAPKRQVLNSIKELENSGLKFSIINYSHTVTSFEPPNLHDKLKETWYDGGTSFRVAFGAIHNYIEGTSADQLDFIFLTDGHAQDNPLGSEAWNTWKVSDTSLDFNQFSKYLKNNGKKITVHTFGVGSGHDRGLLEKIREAGTIAGTYNYAESNNNEIVDEIYASLNFACSAKDIEVLINGRKRTITVMSEDGKLTGETWLTSIPKSFKLEMDGIISELIPSEQEIDVSFRIALLRRQIYSIKNVKQCLELQKELDQFKLQKISRADRNYLINSVISLQNELDKIRRIFVDNERGKRNQGAIASRLHALSFRSKLSKARRGRTLEQRMLGNSKLLRAMEEKLSKLHQVNKMNKLSTFEHSLFDNIGQLTLNDIMKDDSDNLLVIYIQATRDEIAIDQPVCMSAKLTTTVGSLSTFEKAAMFKIQQVGEPGTGNFDYEKTTEVMKGTSNESINACLPIYGCLEHYQRAATMLPVICGLFFTLSESGYHSKQIPALYAILYRLYRGAKNDRHCEMVEGFRRFCSALYNDKETLLELGVPENFWPSNIIQRFCNNINSHQKSELPTLDILYGCMLASQNGNDKNLHSTNLPENFPGILLTEVIRRIFNNKVRGEHPELYYKEAISMVTSDLACPNVAVDELPSIKGEEFVEVTFDAYVFPNKHRKLIEFDFIPSNLEEFKNIPKIKMTSDQYNSIRYAAILQGCIAADNDRFHKLIESGNAVLDPSDEASVARLHSYVWKQHNQAQKLRWKTAVNKRRDEEHAEYLVFTLESIADFTNTLVALKVSHGQGLWKEIIKCMFCEGWEHIPNYERKLSILLLGGCPAVGPEKKFRRITESGTWMAGPEYGKLCRERLGSEFDWLFKILDKQILKHSYRPSGVKNRHGHSRSHPLWEDMKNREKYPKLWEKNVGMLVKKWDA